MVLVVFSVVRNYFSVWLVVGLGRCPCLLWALFWWASASLLPCLSRSAGGVNVFMITTTLDAATSRTKTMRWETPGGS